MSLENFFKDKDAILLVDGMAKRYGKTPFEILTCQTVYEFNFNAGVMLGALNIEEEMKEQIKDNLDSGAGKKEGKEELTLKDFGIKHVVQKTKKG